MKEAKRRRRIIAIILSMAMVFSMNTALLAAEPGEQEYDVPSEEGAAVLDVSGSEEEAALSEVVTNEVKGHTVKSDRDIAAWECEVASNSGADVYLNPDGHGEGWPDAADVFSIIPEKDAPSIPIENEGARLNFRGSLRSGNLLIDVGVGTREYVWGDTIRYMARLKKSYDNDITISVSRGDLSGSLSSNLIKVYVVRWDEDTINSKETSYGGEAKYNIGLIERECINFDLDPDLEINQEGIYTVDREYCKGTLEYYVYTIKLRGMDDNAPSQSVNMVVGNYTISYFQQIPFFGKQKKMHLGVGGSSIFGKIVASDNTTGEYYDVKTVKVTRLKNAPSNQGPYPTVSNAGIQITKLYVPESKKKSGKKMQKELKELTKVSAEGSLDSVKLPVIIYPRRLTDDISISKTGTEKARKGKYDKICTLKGRKGKYKLSFFVLRKKSKLKNGGKDSFKTGTTEVDFNPETGKLSANSADVWTGPNGLSYGCFDDSRAKKDKAAYSYTAKTTK
ncbi:MAG: hypothetical protein IJU87_04240 [Lachnospiraceae bacterium]|nr:hypothetical protein [Lachnospiraceae bacterium]